MNNLCCILNPWIGCSECEWVICLLCPVYSSPWDTHNKAFPDCVISKIGDLPLTTKKDHRGIFAMVLYDRSNSGLEITYDK